MSKVARLRFGSGFSRAHETQNTLGRRVLMHQNLAMRHSLLAGLGRGTSTGARHQRLMRVHSARARQLDGVIGRSIRQHGL